MKNEELSKLPLNGWPLPNYVLEELGRLSVVWATLENTLWVSIGKLLRLEDGHPISAIFIHTNFPQKLDMLGFLCEEYMPHHELLESRKVISKLRSAQKGRNKFLHNCIFHDRESDQIRIVCLSARGKLTGGAERITIADLRRVTAEIHDGTVMLRKLIFKNNNEDTFGKLAAKLRSKVAGPAKKRPSLKEKR